MYTEIRLGHSFGPALFCATFSRITVERNMTIMSLVEKGNYIDLDLLCCRVYPFEVR
jgi:hypothetical protein